MGFLYKSADSVSVSISFLLDCSLEDSDSETEELSEMRVDEWLVFQLDREVGTKKTLLSTQTLYYSFFSIIIIYNFSSYKNILLESCSTSGSQILCVDQSVLFDLVILTWFLPLMPKHWRISFGPGYSNLVYIRNK